MHVIVRGHNAQALNDSSSEAKRAKLEVAKMPRRSSGTFLEEMIWCAVMLCTPKMRAYVWCMLCVQYYAQLCSGCCSNLQRLIAWTRSAFLFRWCCYSFLCCDFSFRCFRFSFQNFDFSFRCWGGGRSDACKTSIFYSVCTFRPRENRRARIPTSMEGAFHQKFVYVALFKYRRAYEFPVQLQPKIECVRGICFWPWPDLILALLR